MSASALPRHPDGDEKDTSTGAKENVRRWRAAGNARQGDAQVRYRSQPTSAPSVRTNSISSVGHGRRIVGEKRARPDLPGGAAREGGNPAGGGDTGESAQSSSLAPRGNGLDLSSVIVDIATLSKSSAEDTPRSRPVRTVSADAADPFGTRASAPAKTISAESTLYGVEAAEPVRSDDVLRPHLGAAFAKPLSSDSEGDSGFLHVRWSRSGQPPHKRRRGDERTPARSSSGLSPALKSPSVDPGDTLDDRLNLLDKIHEDIKNQSLELERLGGSSVWQSLSVASSGTEPTVPEQELSGKISLKDFERLVPAGSSAGVLFRAHHRKSQSNVVLKLLASLGPVPCAREIAALRICESPHVISLLSYFVVDPHQTCLVLGPVEGDLFSFLESRAHDPRVGSLSEVQARPIAHNIAAGLAHCHEKGVILRDLKLER
jgi:Protein kinase domain